MGRHRRGLAYFGLLLTVVLSGCGHRHGWNGTWRLNASKSKIPGSTFSISTTPAGEYREESGGSGYDFGCDGKDYPTSPDHTISCTQRTTSVMDTTAKVSGHEVGTAHWELSGDGKTLTVLSIATQTKESVKPIESSYERVSGTGSFVGEWKNAKAYRASPQTLQLALKDQTLHILYPESGQYADPTLDGADTTMHGPKVPDGLTISIQQGSPLELLTVSKYKGTIVNQGSLQLSADGRSLQEEFSRPGSSQKAELVYDKQ